MPELPDVQVYKETIDAASQHSRIETVHVAADELLDVSGRTLRRRLNGHALWGTRRRGKWLFVAAGDGWPRLHFGMTGLPVYRNGGEPPEFAKLALDFDDGGTLHIVSRRKLGRIGWIDDPDRWIEAERLGTDPLATDGFELDSFRERLEVSRGMIKTTLMNQQKDGADCPRCGGTIRRRCVSGRSSYWCPSHQGPRS